MPGATKESRRDGRAWERRVLIGLSIGYLLSALVLIWQWPEDWGWALGSSIMATAVLAGFWSGSATRKTAFSAGLLGMFLLVPELILRFVGFEYRPEFSLQLEDGRKIPLQPDPELLWVLPIEEGEDEWARMRARPEAVRIAFFGDSCTQQGFPQRVEKAMGTRVLAHNFGVSGYSSFQGRVLTEKVAKRFRPQFSFVAFGWNDHWQAYGAIDAKRESPRPPLAFVDHVRSAQMLSYLLAPKPLGCERVPLRAFRENLVEMGRRLEDVGSQVIFLTLPSGHESLGVPETLLQDGFFQDAKALIRTHALYEETIREVADEHHWGLVDLSHQMKERRDLDALFLKDGIHFRAAGLEWIAQRITAFLEANYPNQF